MSVSVTEAPLQELLSNAPAPPRAPEPRRPGGDLPLTIGIGVATIAAVFPISRLLEPTWLLAAVLVTGLVLALGWVLRRAGLPGWAAALGELILWILCATVALGDRHALLGVVPTFDVLGGLPGVFARVGDEILNGVAPMQPSHELWWVIVAATGMLGLLVGWVVRGTHLPLLAALLLIIVFVIPQLAVPGDPDLVGAVFLIAAILWIVRTEIRVRRPAMEAGPVAATWSVVLGVGSVVVALIAAPLVPLADAIGGGVGRTTSINATLDLGQDLRRPEDVEVLRVRTTAPSAPYLRVATLSRFDGEEWAPDAAGRGSLEFGEIVSDAETEKRTTTIDITRLTSSYLPVTYPATELQGAVGIWSANPFNRTVFSSSEGTGSLGQRYVVTSEELQPTREQARAVMPRIGEAPVFSFDLTQTAEFDADTLQLPNVDIGGVTRAAQEAVGSSANAYDALIAMQSWFRTSGGFRYSLDAPVEEGFDGSGMDAIDRFLEVRAGYCVHFASAFAVMARSIGIPSRVVVGYLPGESTGDRVDDQVVYSVLGSQLHAWPEAYLEGIGWIAFDPTATLGTPTSLRSGETGGPDPSATPGASAAPTPAPTRTIDQDRGDLDNPTSSARAFDPTVLIRTLLIVLGVFVLLLVPAVIRAVRWRTRHSAARRGDAGAAWRELQDLVIDAGFSVDESDSPRVFAARLAREHGVPAATLAPLVDGIERASFAPPTAQAGPDLARALTGARRVLLPAGRERLRAALMPRSLLVRPRVVER